VILVKGIKFDLDNKGARVENFAMASIIGAMPGDYEKPKIREFILDELLWLIMKRKDSENPYFILGVNNTNIMEIVV
jgi:hypothetical protein